MATYLIQDTTLSSIADAIRVKAGTSSAFSPAQMVSEIENLPSGGSGQDTALIEGTISEYTNSMISQVRAYAFYSYTSLTSIDLPNASDIGTVAFFTCYRLTAVNLPNVSNIGKQAFKSCSSLTSIDLPNVSYIGGSAFAGCITLTSISVPNASHIDNGAFYGCRVLTSIDLPNVSYIGSSAFSSCRSLVSVNLPKVSNIKGYAFAECYNLRSLYLTGSILCKLASTDVFISTPISGYTTSTGGVHGSIYVPASLLASYKTATNWAAYSSRFVSI